MGPRAPLFFNKDIYIFIHILYKIGEHMLEEIQSKSETTYRQIRNAFGNGSEKIGKLLLSFIALKIKEDNTKFINDQMLYTKVSNQCEYTINDLLAIISMSIRLLFIKLKGTK